MYHVNIAHSCAFSEKYFLSQQRTLLANNLDGESNTANDRKIEKKRVELKIG